MQTVFARLALAPVLALAAAAAVAQAPARDVPPPGRSATSVMGAPAAQPAADPPIRAIVVAPPYPRAIVVEGPLAVATGVPPQSELSGRPLPPLDAVEARSPSR